MGANISLVGINGSAPTVITTLSNRLPSGFNLNQNYPNPFSTSTTITFEAPETGHYSLIVYDFTGREIAMLLNGIIPAGRQQFEWKGTSSIGQQVCSGAYFYQLKDSHGLMENKKMLLLR